MGVMSVKNFKKTWVGYRRLRVILKELKIRNKYFKQQQIGDNKFHNNKS